MEDKYVTVVFVEQINENPANHITRHCHLQDDSRCQKVRGARIHSCSATGIEAMFIYVYYD